jgi:hypothetical protein
MPSFEENGAFSTLAELTTFSYSVVPETLYAVFITSTTIHIRHCFQKNFIICEQQ